MMVRTQIQLTEEQADALKDLSAQRGLSMAELIRQSVERFISEAEEKQKWRRAMEIVGKYHDEAIDVSVNHDKYLDETYSS